jgi:hypothetical protein
MADAELRQRPVAKDVPGPNLTAGASAPARDDKFIHPAGEAKHGQFISTLRAISFGAFFMLCSIR